MALTEEQKLKLGLDTPEKAAAFEAKYGIAVGPIAPGSAYSGGMSAPSMDMSDGAAVSAGAPPGPPPAGMSGMNGQPTPAVTNMVNMGFGTPKPLVPGANGAPTPVAPEPPPAPAPPPTTSAANGTPPGLKDSLTVKYVPADPTPPAMGGGPSAPAGPPPPDPWWKSYLEKYPDRVREHMRIMGEGAAGEHNMFANSLMNQAAKNEEHMRAWQEKERERAEAKKLEAAHIKKGMDAYEAKNKELANKGISADNIWATRDTGASVLSILGMFMGAFATPYTGGKNLAVEQFERMVDRDLAIQKYNLENEKEGLKNQGGILQDWMNIYRDKDMAFNAAKASYWQMAGKEIENMGAKAKGEIAKAQVPLMLEQAQFKADAYTAQVAQGLKAKAEQEAMRLLMAKRMAAGAGAGGGAATGIIADIEKAGGIHAYKKFVDSHGYPPIVKSEKVFAQDGPNKGQYLGTHILVIDPKTNTVVDKVAANGKNAVNVAAFGPGGAAIVNKDGILQVNPAMASSPDAVKKINDANTAFSSAKSAVKTIVNLRKQVGWTGKWKDTDGVKAQLKDAYGRYIAALTVLRNTGVMSQGEYDRYRKEVPDPTSGDWNPANFGSGDGVLASWEALDPQLDFSYKNNVNFLLASPNGPMTEGYEENKGKLDATDADKDDE